jgi:hypothetical protein
VTHAALHRHDEAYSGSRWDIAEAAVELAEWFAAQQLSLLAAGRNERKAERLDRLKTELAIHPNKRATKRVLQRSHGFERDEVDALARAFPHVLRVEAACTGEVAR